MSEFNCLLGIHQLKHFNKVSQIRRKIRNCYNNHLSKVESIKIPRMLYDDKLTDKSNEMFPRTKDNFAKIAEDMGAIGLRVENPGEIKPAFQRALEEELPVVIDIVSDIEVVAPLAWEKPE